ncbi:MAG: hypothetical protein N2380_02760 [bacterium]|nr:hypothetical protein [bacterium]
MSDIKSKLKGGPEESKTFPWQLTRFIHIIVDYIREELKRT